MQDGKARSIGVDLEHRAIARTAALHRRSIQGGARYNQSRPRSSPVAVSETMQVRKTRAIGVDGEHRAIARTAAAVRRPIQGVAR